MEVNKKLRGQKHHYNKARYQNKAKVIPKTVCEKTVLNRNRDTVNEQTENERGLTSNWHRYEESPEEDKIDESTNFSLLAQAPISQGGHFQFKSDKNVESEFDFETLRKNKMFALDLYLLESGLNTIPFHRRCDLDESHFTEDQLKEINIRSRQNTAQHESYLKMNAMAKEFSTQTLSDSENKRSSEQHKNKAVGAEIKTLPTTKTERSSSEILSTNVFKEIPEYATETDKVSTTKDLKEDKDALEEWLDDILND